MITTVHNICVKDFYVLFQISSLEGKYENIENENLDPLRAKKNIHKKEDGSDCTVSDD